MRTRRGLLAGLLIVGSLVGPMTAPANAASILAGSDYRTTSAAVFDFGPGIGAVALVSAFAPGVANSVVTRLSDASLPVLGSSDTVPIQMRLFELRSLAAVLVGGSFFDVFVHLDPTLPSAGSMTISHDFPDNGTPDPEGRFTSSVVVNYIAEFEPIGPGTAFSLSRSLALATAVPFVWSHEPPPGVLLVPGAPGDLDANLHAPLPPGFNDFFPLFAIELGPGTEVHVTQLASERGRAALQPIRQAVPEPGTLILLLCGIGLLASALRRNWTTANL